MAMHLPSGSNSDDLDVLHEINVTPFIDVMLVLLIIFMVAAPLATVDIGVNLPASTAPEQPRPDKPVFVTIKSDATIAIGETIVPRAELGASLDAATSSHKDATIFVRGACRIADSASASSRSRLRVLGPTNVLPVASISARLVPTVVGLLFTSLAICRFDFSGIASISLTISSRRCSAVR